VLENIIIKIEKNGKDSKPSYSLLLRGSGELIFRYLDNAKNKRENLDKINEKDFLEILSNFKEIDFFKYKNKFQVEKYSPRPYTTISITVPIDEEKSRTTSVTYHDDDSSVPEELIKLEKNINNIIGFDKWISKINYKHIKKEVKTAGEKNNIGSRKKIIISVIGIIIAFLIITAIFLFVLDNKDTVNEQSSQNNTPEITYISTTSSNKRNNGERPSKNDFFTQGDTIYVDFEYNKFFDDNTTLISNITILGEEKRYYNKHLQIEAKPANLQDCYSIIGFLTNKSWPISQMYTITIKITDITTGNNCQANVSFNLSDSNNSGFNPLIANIIEITVFDNLSIYFEGGATGGTGIYSYTWTFKDLSENLIGTEEGKSGTYSFGEIMIVDILLTVNDTLDTDNYKQTVYVK